MKTITQSKFDSIIKYGFHEVLKPLGFKKKSNNFYIQLEELGQIINIQKSQWGSKDDISFTINIGIFIPEYWLGLLYNKNKELPKFPTEPECLIRKRIGEIKNQSDTWYSVDEDTNEKNVIIEMQKNVKDYILPYFRQIDNQEKAIEILDKEILHLSPLGKLIFYGEIKLIDKAKKEYHKFFEVKTNPHFIKTVKEYGQKYDLE